MKLTNQLEPTSEQFYLKQVSTHMSVNYYRHPINYEHSKVRSPTEDVQRSMHYSYQLHIVALNEVRYSIPRVRPFFRL